MAEMQDRLDGQKLLDTAVACYVVPCVMYNNAGSYKRSCVSIYFRFSSF